MRVLLLGGTGMLGSDLRSELQALGHDVVAPGRDTLNIVDPVSVALLTSGAFGQLDFCINCSAYTAVDRAEEEPELANAVNAIGPGYLASACRLAGVRLIHVSTDFVFDGRTDHPYVESDPPDPLGAYGKSKLEGEFAVMKNAPDSIIARTSWLYGPNGNSFPKTMIRAWAAQKNLRVVSDQIGTPTYTVDLARTLCSFMKAGAEPGIYHTAGPDVMSWHDFATMAISTYAKAIGSDRLVDIEPIKTEDWPTPAKRPAYSALATERPREVNIVPVRSTEKALTEFVSRLSL